MGASGRRQLLQCAPDRRAVALLRLCLPDRNCGCCFYAGNLHNQFFDNYVVEGNHVFNYNGSYLYPHGKVRRALSHPERSASVGCYPCWLSLVENKKSSQVLVDAASDRR